MVKETKVAKKKVTKKTTKKKVVKAPVKEVSKPVVKARTKPKTKEIDDKVAAIGVILVVIAIITLFNMFFVPAYAYNFEVNGINYSSNYFTPSEFKEIIKNQDLVYVSPVFEENNAEPIMANAMNLWQVVLIVNHIEAIQLIRSVDSENNLLYCNTNYGDPTKNVILEADECKTILNNNFSVFIETGNPNVILDQNAIIIYSNSGNMSNVNFSVISEVFPNAKEALDIVNEKIYGIN